MALTLDALGKRGEILDSKRHEAVQRSVDYTQETYYADAARLVSDFQMGGLTPAVLGLSQEAPAEQPPEDQVVELPIA